MLEEKNDHQEQETVEVINNTQSTSQSSSQKEIALQNIEESNAADNESHTIEETSDLPKTDYENLSLELLAEELKEILSKYKVTLIKEQVEEIRKVFFQKYNELLDDKKDQFLNENPDALEHELEFSLPIKTTFDALVNDYRTKRNTHYKDLEKSLSNNLEKRLEIIEKIRALVDNSENMADALKSISVLREEWRNAGPIPKDKYNHVWNNFHFHIERFYDQLHLDRESRDLDFKYNLEQKQKIIARAEELLKEDDIIKAYRELRTLHRIWREEIGPVDREVREEIWSKFSDISSQLYDKKEELFAHLKQVELDNLRLKVSLISQIDIISKENYQTHNEWQAKIEEIEALKAQFYAIGKVPAENTDEVWKLFKLAGRNFNSNKNNFYKSLKQNQQDNLNKKLKLIEKAEAFKDSEDFKTTTPIMKEIQEEWKVTGRTPRKHDAALWKQFREACNHYFDRLHTERNKENESETVAYNKKKEYLELLRGFMLSGDHKTDLDEIKNHIQNWKSLGKVSPNKRFIESKFNRVLDVLFKKLSLTKREAESVRFNNRIDDLMEQNDKYKIQQEGVFLQRKIDEIHSNILQLQNNIQFISNATEDNPFIKEVRKSIKKHEEELESWKAKLTHLKSLDL